MLNIHKVDTDKCTMKIVGAVLSYLLKLAHIIDCQIEPKETLSKSKLYLIIRELIEYGKGNVQCDGQLLVKQTCQVLAPICSGPFVKRESIPISLLRNIINIADARAALNDGSRNLSSSELACLAGVTSQTVRLAITTGKLEAKLTLNDGSSSYYQISSDDCKRYLESLAS